MCMCVWRCCVSGTRERVKAKGFWWIRGCQWPFYPHYKQRNGNGLTEGKFKFFLIHDNYTFNSWNKVSHKSMTNFIITYSLHFTQNFYLLMYKQILTLIHFSPSLDLFTQAAHKQLIWCGKFSFSPTTLIKIAKCSYLITKDKHF